MSLLTTINRLRANPSDEPSRFVLRYTPQEGEPVVVGHLEFDGHAWSFRYADEYKRRTDLRPIEGFDELEREYRSTYLFPFFEVRVPDLAREDVRREIALHRMRRPSKADMLRLFGRRVVSSPGFELVPV